jgi:hypothetical protein
MPQVIEARYTIGPQLVALLARLFPGQYYVEVSRSADARHLGCKAVSKALTMTFCIYSFGGVDTLSRHRGH